jgi:hypothetical protein
MPTPIEWLIIGGFSLMPFSFIEIKKLVAHFLIKRG